MYIYIYTYVRWPLPAASHDRVPKAKDLLART